MNYLLSLDVMVLDAADLLSRALTSEAHKAKPWNSERRQGM